MLGKVMAGMCPFHPSLLTFTRLTIVLMYHSPLNLYVHVPFCAQKCGFCNLYTVTLGDKDVKAASRSPLPTLEANASGAATSTATAVRPVWKFNSNSPTDVARYANALVKEFDTFRSVMDQPKVRYDSIHFGGGTPTLMYGIMSGLHYALVVS
jgi:coproporphyrinogen III oxidase-like Fe-S oxidoreductase